MHFPLLKRLISGVALLSLLVFTSCTRGENDGDQAKVANPVEEKSRAVLGASAVWEPAPEDGVELGFGWDSLKGRIVPNRCVSMTPVRATGQVARVSLSEVSDTSEVMKSLKVSASVSAKSMFASGSAASSFAKSSNVSAQSTTFLLDATVENGVLFAGPRGPADRTRLAFPAVETPLAQSSDEAGQLTFQPWAQKLLNRGSEFRAYCGDAYVSAISSGARLFATISFTSTNSTNKKNVSAAIKGTYGPVKAEGAVATAHNTTLSNASLDVQFLQVGGARGKIAVTKDGLLEKLNDLAREADDFPRFQYVRLTPYSQMPEWRGVDTWQQTEDEFEIIADYYWQLTNLDDEIDTILANYNDYNNQTGKTRDDLKVFQDDILQLRSLIWSAMQPKMGSATDVGTVAVVAVAAKPLTLFDAPAASEFKAPTPVNVSILSGNPTLKEVAATLATASPFGNPSLLRINLPIPTHVTTKTSADDLQQEVVDWYVKPRAKRSCDRDPTSKDCLSNAQLKDLQAMVQVRDP